MVVVVVVVIVVEEVVVPSVAVVEVLAVLVLIKELNINILLTAMSLLFAGSIGSVSTMGNRQL